MIFDRAKPYSVDTQGNYVVITFRIPHEDLLPRSYWDEYFGRRPVDEGERDPKIAAYKAKIASAVDDAVACGSVSDASKRSGVLCQTIRSELRAREVSRNADARLALRQSARDDFLAGLSVADLVVKYQRSDPTIRAWLKG